MEVYLAFVLRPGPSEPRLRQANQLVDGEHIDANRTVAPGRGQMDPVRAEGHAARRESYVVVGVGRPRNDLAIHDQLLLECAPIPQPNRAVGGDSSQPAPIRREGEAEHRSEIRADGTDLATGPSIPQPKAPVVASRDQVSTIGAERNQIGRGGLRELGENLTVVYPPQVVCPVVLPGQ